MDLSRLRGNTIHRRTMRAGNLAATCVGLVTAAAVLLDWDRHLDPLIGFFAFFVLSGVVGSASAVFLGVDEGADYENAKVATHWAVTFLGAGVVLISISEGMFGPVISTIVCFGVVILPVSLMSAFITAAFLDTLRLELDRRRQGPKLWARRRGR